VTAETPSSGLPPTPGAAAPWWGRALSLVALVGAAIGAGWYAWAHPWTAGAIAAFIAFGFGLAILRARSRRARAWLDRATEGFERWYARALFWLTIALGPLLLARTLAEVAADVPLGVAVALLATWAAVFLFLVLQVSTDARRRRLWRRLRSVDAVTPFLYAFAVAFVAIILFSTLAFVLAERDVIRFGTGPASARAVAEPADALDFFVWHLLDSVPSLDVTDTLRWKEPLGYTDGGVGVLLLAFKILVIGPIVAAFLAFWRYSREPADVGSPTRLRLGDSPRAPRRRGR
jgi:hypothetical protein